MDRKDDGKAIFFFFFAWRGSGCLGKQESKTQRQLIKNTQWHQHGILSGQRSSLVLGERWDPQGGTGQFEALPKPSFEGTQRKGAQDSPSGSGTACVGTNLPFPTV